MPGVEEHLDAQHQEDTTMEEEGNDEMVDELVAKASPSDIASIDLAVSGRKQELIDRLNGHLYPHLARKRKLDITNLDENEEKKKEKKQHEDVSPVNSNIGQANHNDDGK